MDRHAEMDKLMQEYEILAETELNLSLEKMIDLEAVWNL